LYEIVGGMAEGSRPPGAAGDKPLAGRRGGFGGL